MKAIRDMKFPEWVVQWNTRSGRTGFRIYRIINASTQGADVDIVMFGLYSMRMQRPYNEKDKHISYSRLRKMGSPNRLHDNMKRSVIKSMFEGDHKI